MGRNRAGVATAIATAWLAAAPAFALPPERPLDTWAPDDDVYDVVRAGDSVFLAGPFEHVGPVTGGGARIDAASGRADLSWPDVNGGIEAVEPDGMGGYYIGGSFTRVGGEPRRHLAQIDAGGRVTDFRADTGLGAVLALARAGDTLYVAGRFEELGGAARKGLASVTRAGQVTDWDPTAVRGDSTEVTSLSVTADAVYAAGDFATVAGEPNEGAVKIPLGTDDPVDGWAPDFDNGHNATWVYEVAAAGPMILVSGTFSHVDGVARRNLVALDAATGKVVEDWSPDPDAAVSDVEVAGGEVYLAGAFTEIGGVARSRLAALDLGSGAPTPWAPEADGAVRTLFLDGGRAIVGGNFRSLAGEPRPYLGAVDVSTGAATGWNPRPDGPVRDLDVASGAVYAGGALNGINVQSRAGLAALDAASGELTAFEAEVSGSVGPLAAGDGMLLAAVSNSWEDYELVALDQASGSVRWTLSIGGGEVYALAAAGDTLYVGGWFTELEGVARDGLAAIDVRTGAVTGWNPGADYDVWALAVADDVVYAGGDFEEIGGQQRVGLAAIDRATGAVSDWKTAVAGGVRALALAGPTLYVGGYLWEGDVTRSSLAAVDVVTGAVRPWSPATPGSVEAVAVSGSTVYAALGEGWWQILAVDALTGLPEPWNPEFVGDAWELKTHGSTLYAAGDFTYIEDEARWSFAAFGQPAPSNLAPPSIAGEPRVGQRLGCATGEWSPAPATYAYAWLRDGAPIAAGREYTLAAADAGRSLACRVTARNDTGARSAVSAAVVPAAGPQPPEGGHPPPPADGDAPAPSGTPASSGAFPRGGRPERRPGLQLSVSCRPTARTCAVRLRPDTGARRVRVRLLRRGRTVATAERRVRAAAGRITIRLRRERRVRPGRHRLVIVQVLSDGRRLVTRRTVKLR